MPRGVYDRTQSETQTAEDSAPVSPRAEEMRTERRRRDAGDLDRGARLKLAIPKEVQDRAEREGKTLRWINDDGNRMAEMTEHDDWDKVPGVRQVPVGTSVDGKPINAILCAKNKDWYEDDQRAKAKVLNEREAAVARGARASSEDSLPGDVRYVAQGNRISRGA